MIQSGAKVTSDKTDEGEVIAILPEVANWQRMAIGIWLVIWVMAGILGMVGGLKSLAKDELTFLLVFAGFWFYFLFYAARSLLWMNMGAEYLRITDEHLEYKRSWNGYGSVKQYDLATIKNIGVVNYSDKTFAKSYSDAFWTIGGEMIGFEYIGQKVAVGFKLSEQDAKQLSTRIRKAVQQAQRNAESSTPA
jgi:hypothetical protein